MGTWRQSGPVTKTAWSVVRSHSYLIAFPVLSGVIAFALTLALVGMALGILGISGQLESASAGAELSTATIILGLMVLLIAAVVGTFIVQFFAGALVFAANEELQGRSSSIGAGFQAALRRVGPLAGWSLIVAGVGWLLNLIRGGNSDNVVVTVLRVAATSVVAMAWQVVTYFVLPMIMLDHRGPLAAIRESVALIKRTWGMQITGGVRVGARLFVYFGIPGLLLLIGGSVLVAQNHPTVGVPLIFLGVVAIVAMGVLGTTVRGVYSVALLHWAQKGQVLGPFTATDLQQAAVSRSPR